MGSFGTYYLDTLNFANATSVYTDAALTTCAPDGFYQIGGVSRQQVNCSLLPSEACPSCPGATPVPPATLPPNVSYKVTDKKTGTIGHVTINTAYNLNTDVTTTLSANCWLINEESTTVATGTITGLCIVDPGADPIYYRVILCPSIPQSSAPTQQFTPTAPDITSLSQQYYDPINEVYYIYDNAGGTTSPTGGEVNTVLDKIPNVFGCPALPIQYNYWNAQECDGVQRIIFQAPVDQVFVSGVSVVKIAGSSICYTVLTGTNTVNDNNIFSTVYSSCDECDPPAVEPDGFIISQAGLPNNEVLVDLNNRSVGDKVITNINADCWELIETTTTSTTNTITADCPPPIACTTYTLKADTNADATFTYTRCDNESITVLVVNGETDIVCAKTDTVVLANPLVGSFDAGTSCSQAEFSQPYQYYTAVACNGPISGVPITIIRVPFGREINIFKTSVKLNTACLFIIGTSNTQVVGNDPSDIFANCIECIGTLCCSAFCTYNPSSSCDVTPGAATWVYYLGSTQEARLDTAVLLYSVGGEFIRQSTNYAPAGWYTQVSGASAITGTLAYSRFWDGTKFTQSQVCIEDPIEYTATLIGLNGAPGINNKLTGGEIGTAYLLRGDATGSRKDLKQGDAFSFNTTVEVIPPYVGVGISVANFQIASPPGIQDNVTGVTVITGQLTIPSPVGVYYMVFESCGNGNFYNLENATIETLNSLFLIGLNVTGFNGVICATLISQSTTKPTGWVVSNGVTGIFSSVNNCGNKNCFPGMNNNL